MSSINKQSAQFCNTLLGLLKINQCNFHSMWKYIVILVCAQSILIMNANAFGGKSFDSDPPSTIGTYFTDEENTTRPPLNPSNFLTEQQIQEAWNKAKFNKLKNSWMDWDVWLNLNLEAARVWTQIVECAGSIEKARINYYNINFCRNDNTKDAAIKNELLLLHGNIRDFAMSSSIKYPEMSITEIKDELEKIRNTIPLHPLFTQMLLELGATVVKFNEKQIAVHRIGFDDSWIDPIYYESFGIRVSDLIHGRTDNKSDYSTARLYLNTHLLLNILPKDHFEAWGLWSEASRILTHLITIQFLPDDMSTEFNLLKDFIGFSSSEKPYGSAIIGNTSMIDSVVTEFRSLAERYGIPTHRERICFSKPLSYYICWAIDPANPNEPKRE